MVFAGNFLNLWASNGIFDFALPFVLFFAIIFSILYRTKILGDNKSIDAVVAMVISLFIISNPLTAPFLARVFSSTGTALIILIASLIIMGLFTEKSDMGNTFKWIGTIAGTGFFIWLIIMLNDFYAIYNWFPIAFYGINIWNVLFGVVVLGVVIWVVASADKDSDRKITSGVPPKQG